MGDLASMARDELERRESFLLARRRWLANRRAALQHDPRRLAYVKNQQILARAEFEAVGTELERRDEAEQAQAAEVAALGRIYDAAERAAEEAALARAERAEAATRQWALQQVARLHKVAQGCGTSDPNGLPF